LTFAEAMIQAWYGGTTTPPFRGSVVREFTRRQNIVPGSSRALGWDTPTPGSSAGSRLSAESFGHTGFTGTSIWIDPRRRLAIVLLSNRVNPTRDNPRWTSVRGSIADLVMTTLFEDAP
jgi:serine-type D-Ala-D-Ala carboxypeptidase